MMRDHRAVESIYLDYHASTPCDPRVVDAMLPFLLGNPANPASQLHRLGVEASRAVEAARERVASLVAGNAADVVFTSGATESNNLAILGSAAVAPSRRRKIVVS